MQQFNLDIWHQNNSRKIITRDKKPVRIICWDSPNKGFPIVGFIDDNPTVFVWDKYGYARSGHRESNRDLFFADKEEEEELTEFEKKLIEFRNKTPLISVQYYENGGKDFIHNYAQILLDLARKEICLTCKEYSRGYQEGLKLGREDALKDLPKWECFATIPDYSKSGTYLTLLDGFLYNIITHKRIGLTQLEKLPKAE